MNIRCIWEHNGNDTLLYAEDFIGAFTRGESRESAINKMQKEIVSYSNWCNTAITESFLIDIVQEKPSELQICDADSDVIFDSEKQVLTKEEYLRLKKLALKSARDFWKLYQSVPDKHRSSLPRRKTFYGYAPRTAKEMYTHTKNVNSYYFGEIGIDVDNSGTIYSCRKRGFDLLEQCDGFLNNKLFAGSFGEEWSLRKLFRRFIWHDRIHAKALYRMAISTFGEKRVANLFQFDQ